MRKFAAIACALFLAGTAGPARAETLYNGIVLPSVWPPRDQPVGVEPAPLPFYLASPPAVIPIDVGRQLFVDSFLIDATNLRRTFHAAEYYPGNPVIRPDQPWECEGIHHTAMPFSDGIWYDPKDRCYKAWYHGGGAKDYYTRNPYTMYATSPDGVHWVKPRLDVKPGTNIVHVDVRDSGVVWLDLEEKNPTRRYKFVYSHGVAVPASLYYSADGIHWGSEVTRTPPTGDRFTAFWNPFRRVWVASIRYHVPVEWPKGLPSASSATRSTVLERAGPRADGWVSKASANYRIRLYHEGPDLPAALHWKDGEPVAWTGADRLDPMRVDLGVRTQLYCVDAVAYESVMLGLFSIWRGQPPLTEREKPNEIAVGFSRDGFHWYRPFRQALIPVSEDPAAWNNGNVQSVGGCCLVVGDRLYFYMSGRKGGGAVAGENSTGLATLRRDGFVSMDAPGDGGWLTTRPVRFSGRRLFVNADSSQGELRVEILDENGRVLPGFSADRCLPVSANNTLQAVAWRDGGDLSALAGRPVRFRFHLRYASLYSFWVSPDPSGASHGYVAAGGPGFTGPTDTVGTGIYVSAFSHPGVN